MVPTELVRQEVRLIQMPESGAWSRVRGARVEEEGKMRFLRFLTFALGALGLVVLTGRAPVAPHRPPRLRF